MYCYIWPSKNIWLGLCICRSLFLFQLLATKFISIPVVYSQDILFPCPLEKMVWNPESEAILKVYSMFGRLVFFFS